MGGKLVFIKMACWIGIIGDFFTCIPLLFWVVLKPLERKGVLLLTLVPVMCGIIIAGILAVTYGLVPVSNMVPIWIFNGIIVIVFTLAYYFATVLARKSG